MKSATEVGIKARFRKPQASARSLVTLLSLCQENQWNYSLTLVLKGFKKSRFKIKKTTQNLYADAGRVLNWG